MSLTRCDKHFVINLAKFAGDSSSSTIQSLLLIN